MRVTDIHNIIMICCVAFSLKAQNILTPAEAVTTALQNNFEIRLAENDLEIAANNNSIYNRGILPAVGMDGGVNYRLDNTTANFQNGNSASINNASSESANLALNTAYTIYDGNARAYNIERLEQQYGITQLQLKAVMENVAARVLNQYYLVATLENSLSILDSTIAVSQARLDRTSRFYQFGQATGLELLNARVDLNNDSLAYLERAILLDDAKRQLKNLMVVADTTIIELLPHPEPILMPTREHLYSRMLEANTELAISERLIRVGDLDIAIAQARRLPELDFNASYGLSYNNNNSASFLASQRTYGFSTGITFRWNIFDGGASRTAIENARLEKIGAGLQMSLLENDLKLEFDNAYANYENARLIYNTESRNLEIAKENFDRSLERFKAGQINSVEFRQAQINLLGAEIRVNNSLLNIKTAEIRLLLLSGMILE